MGQPLSEYESTWLRRALKALDGLPPLTKILLLAGVVQSIALADLASRIWFMGDDWDPLLRRGTVPDAAISWWVPHYGNPSMLWIASYRAVFEVVGMRSYLAYALVTIAFHALTCAALYLLLKRVGASAVIAMMTTWVVLFFGGGKDALMFAASMGHTGATAFGVLAAYLLVSREWSLRGTGLALLALTCALMYSAGGVIAVAFVTFLALGLRRWRHAAVLGGLPAAAYLIWYVAVGGAGANAYLPTRARDLTVVPEFVWRTLAWPLGDAIGLREAGAAVLLVLVAVLVLVRDRHRRLWILAVAGLGAVMAHGILLGLTRPMMDASTGRYAYTSFVLMAPAIAFALRVLADRWTTASIPLSVTIAVVGVALGAYTYIGTQVVRQYAGDMALLSSRMPDRLLAMVAAGDAGESVLEPDYGDFVNQDLDPNLVLAPRIRAALPSGEVTPEARLDVELHHMTTVGKTRHGLASPTNLVGLDSFTEDLSHERGCETFTPTTAHPALSFSTGKGAEISVRSASTALTVEIVRDGVTSAKRVFTSAPGMTVISTTARDAALFVSFDDAQGPYEICLR